MFDGSARVLVVSRRRRFRAAFAALLAREGWGAIAATATSIEEAAGLVASSASSRMSGGV